MWTPALPIAAQKLDGLSLKKYIDGLLLPAAAGRVFGFLAVSFRF
jgi:hypothetical protein